MVVVVEESSQRAKKCPKNVAIIFGVTGLVGKELLRKLLLKQNWKVYGIARRPDLTPIQNPRYHFISCNLLNPSEAEKKLSCLQDVTHIFWVTWASQFELDSQECCQQNKAMMSNALNSLLPNAIVLKHFSLQTGTKHYVSLKGPFDLKKDCVFDEESQRVGPAEGNFYYLLEDLLKEKLAGKVPWSVHRPGLIMGNSQRTLYNFMGSLSVYGSICKHLNLPFVFGGTKECWEEMFIDGSDARLVADQHIWSATNIVADQHVWSANNTDHGEAYNSINGHSFIWKDIWGAIGKKFGVVGVFSEDFRYSTEMSDKGGVWAELVAKEELVKTQMNDVANWGFLDNLFRCPIKMLATREKVERLGFTNRCHTLDSIMYWIDVMRNDKLIP